MQAIIHKCDNCPNTYSLPIGQSYDSKNYPGTGWMIIRLEGMSDSSELCSTCAAPILEKLIACYPNLKELNKC